jgi:hypothetical protein
MKKNMLEMTPKGLPRGTQKSIKVIKNHEKSWPRSFGVVLGTVLGKTSKNMIWGYPATFEI